VKGLCARGGFEVDLAWDNGSLTKVMIRSKLGNPCRVRCDERAIQLNTKKGGQYAFNGQLKLAR
jgi:alpha-L-fucosidase 2